MENNQFAIADETFPKLHPVQWQIIKQMSLLSEPHFIDLKPKTIDPRRFTYHLYKLKELDLIRHDAERQSYFLTDKAKALIAYFTDIPSWGNLPLNSGIMLYVLKENKVLVVKRDKQPFIDYTGLPYFYTEKDEFVYQSAQRSLQSLGLTGDLSLDLIIEVLFKNKEEEVIRHAFMLTYYCHEPKGVLKEKSYEGKLFWLSPEDFLAVKPGYDNTKDVVGFFAKSRPHSGVTIISKIYHTPW